MYEDQGNFEACKELVLCELEKLQKKEFVKKLNAREKYDKIQFALGQDVFDHHTSWDDCTQDMRANQNKPDDETLIFNYKKKMDVISSASRHPRPWMPGSRTLRMLF